MPHLTALFVHVQTFLVQTLTAFVIPIVTPGPESGRARLRIGDERGQATTEYALVLLAAALVGLMVVAWATAGGGAARISRLFNSVIDSVIDRV